MTPQTDPRITESMRRDTRRAVWRNVATTSTKPLDTTPAGERGFRIARALVPARFRR